MKKLVTRVTMIVFAGLLLTTGALAQTGTTPGDEPMQPRPPGVAPTTPPAGKAGQEPQVTLGTAKELYANTLLGASVKNSQGENLGKIDEWVIDPRHAQITTAVVAMGGLLGLGGKSVAVPWSEVKSSDDGNTVIIAKAKEALANAPEWKKPEEASKAPTRESASPPAVPRSGSTTPPR